VRPGHKLDALVAEKVMGWTMRINFDYKPPQYEWHEAAGFMKIANHPEQLPQLRVWSPSTRIEDAWQVVEKLASMGHVVEVHTFPPSAGRKAERYQATIRKDLTVTGSCGPGDPFAKSPAHAICIIALKAIRATVPV